jgi:hypothetical protein
MKITAKEYFQPGRLMPFVSWKVESATAFGHHLLEFDLSRLQVIRSNEDGSEIIAQIHPGYKGDKLSRFYGTVESETFIVTKRKKDWLSALTGQVVFDVTMKDSGLASSITAMLYDTYNGFHVPGLLDLKLIDDRSRYRVEGTCAPEYQDLTEVIASLLLHHHEKQVG